MYFIFMILVLINVIYKGSTNVVSFRNSDLELHSVAEFFKNRFWNENNFSTFGMKLFENVFVFSVVER